MACYIVVHHRHDPHQPWANAWEGDSTELLQAITTTAAIGKRLNKGGRAFVHRCGLGPEPPAIVAEVAVKQATKIDGSTWYVTFETTRTIKAGPPRSPGPGTSSYEAAQPPV